MNEKNLKKLLKDENKLNKQIIFYLRHKTISKVEPNINETKGYFSKNHDATLCLLIKEYCEKGLAESDIELMNIAYLNYEDMLFYVKSKNMTL